ncbi:DUF6088 family protein [Spirulina sp. CS-785/01]|uniref:DUF6088 family protein n=1 Tax=Spirulina sp. CS-785/01 TaxID=3021716 RepID=UPI002330F0FF|nr:DUF6088 family protein [Spirulina sp. CS-785/01]MDB9312848.1 DUF6088 family protein [Spirulina sp. CS-785/01]
MSPATGSSVAAQVRQRIHNNGEQYWQTKDFADLSAPAAVTKALSRLATDGTIQRISKGIYYHPRQTRFGKSRPSQSGLHRLLEGYTLHPAGITASSLLGFTTQNSPAGEFATTARSIPRKLLGERVKLYTNRPKTWENLSPKEAAILDFLRQKGQLSDLSPEQTKQLLLEHFQKQSCYPKLVKIALEEPPRVRAILGAIGQELGCNYSSLKQLKNNINPQTRFDFGVLRCLKYAKDWQAK